MVKGGKRKRYTKTWAKEYPQRTAQENTFRITQRKRLNTKQLMLNRRTFKSALFIACEGNNGT